MKALGSLLRVTVVGAIAIVIAVGFDRRDQEVHVISDAADRVKGQVSAPLLVESAVKPAPKAAVASDDPFAPRGWQNVPPPVPPAPVIAPAPVLVAAAPPAVEAPVAPSLPYAFMGQFDDGGRQVIYLSRGDQSFVATRGETLEGAYKVLAMDPRQIEFEHIPTGTKQVLTIPASNN